MIIVKFETDPQSCNKFCDLWLSTGFWQKSVECNYSNGFEEWNNGETQFKLIQLQNEFSKVLHTLLYQPKNQLNVHEKLTNVFWILTKLNIPDLFIKLMNSAWTTIFINIYVKLCDKHYRFFLFWKLTLETFLYHDADAFQDNYHPE